MRPLIVASSIALLIARATAIDITLDFNTSDDQFPFFDADGSKLKAISIAAAQIWEGLQPANATFDWDIHYEALDPASNTLAIANGFDGSIRVRNNFSGPIWGGLGWFFDSSPFDHSEFGGFTQELFRDTTLVQKALFPNGAPPLLEIGYYANGSGGDAASDFDLLTVMLHEMGHLSGVAFNDFAPDVPIPMQFVGNLPAIKVKRGDDAHLGPDNALMNPTIPPGVRRLPSALDIMANANEKGWGIVHLARVDWLGDFAAPGANTWHHATNWAGGSVPLSTSAVTIRGGAQVILDAPAYVSSLRLDEQSTLTLTDDLTVGGNVKVIGKPIFDSASVTIDSGAKLTVDGKLNLALGDVVLAGGSVEANEIVLAPTFSNFQGTNYSSLSGHGTVSVGTILTNHSVVVGDGGVLVIAAAPGAALDLSDGGIRAATGDLDLQGSFAAHFAGIARVDGGHFIHFDHDFFTKEGATIEIKAGTGVAELADKAAAATIALTDNSVMTVEAGANARIAAGQIVFQNSHTSVGAGAVLVLDGPVWLANGSLGGSSTAIIRQNGNATMTAINLVDVGEYDWDGALATPVNTTLSQAAKLTINAMTLGGDYAGQVTIGNGAQLEVNMTGATPLWTLAQSGKITFEDSGNLAGSTLSVRGRIDALGGANLISAPIIVEPSAQIKVADKVTLNFKGAVEFKGGLVGTLSGTMEGSTIGHFAAADVRGAQSITAGFFNWDGSDDTESLTKVPAGSSLTINALNLGTLDGQRASFGDTAIIGGTLHMNIGGEHPDYGTFQKMWTLNANGTLVLDGVPGGVTPVVKGSQFINRGLVDGSGGIQSLFENNGLIEIGHAGAAGALVATAGFSQRKDGTLHIELGGTVPVTGYDQLTLALNGDLAGTLDVNFIGGFFPAYGDTFRVVGGTASVGGTFDTVNLPPLPGDGWDVIYGGTYVDIRAVPEPSSRLLLVFSALVGARRRRTRKVEI